MDKSARLSACRDESVSMRVESKRDARADERAGGSAGDRCDRALFCSLVMARFIVGDELGNLKALRYALGQKGEAPLLTTTLQGSAEGSTRTAQALAVSTADNETIVRRQPSVVPGH